MTFRVGVVVIVVAGLALGGMLLLARPPYYLGENESRCLVGNICVQSEPGRLTVTWPVPTPTLGPYFNWYAQAYPTVTPAESRPTPAATPSARTATSDLGGR